ncbi:FadR family transcriptional regulator [Pseudooceanicola sp. CBS1P-1]|uniref:FCD domain-containing protein n=1 Tax=Pseudooceanicola albus TaxID=2692189 RepID=A0A6L7G4S3_9RHOB|nr:MULTISPECIES: FadR/GntR family transcriptional regulator [Pseudooceanicola]MBT9385190.1 FadR family transcriptional regulator [Pseudooceanicola endophyticus]MXN18518.1 FCD domain-containing protein [Pseudooceanicola albus]
MDRPAPKPQVTLGPLEKQDRVSLVSRALADFIQTAELKPGDRLPAERVLMETLGVGRSTIREVIGRFQALGVVEIRKGSGTYLRRRVSASTIQMPLSIDAASLGDALRLTLEVRRGLEVQASAIAAARRSETDLRQIEACLLTMEEAHEREGSAGRADLAFHLAIYDATGNPLFRQLLEQMREGFERFWDQPFDRPDFAARSFPLHRDLYEAIAAGDPAQAVAITTRILDIVEEDLEVLSK